MPSFIDHLQLNIHSAVFFLLKPVSPSMTYYNLVGLEGKLHLSLTRNIADVYLPKKLIGLPCYRFTPINIYSFLLN